MFEMKYIFLIFGRLNLTCVNKFVPARSVVQNGASVSKKLQLETVFIFKMLGEPGEICCKAFKFVPSAPAPHSFAALCSASPVVQISGPIACAPCSFFLIL